MQGTRYKMQGVSFEEEYFILLNNIKGGHGVLPFMFGFKVRCTNNCQERELTNNEVANFAEPYLLPELYLLVFIILVCTLWLPCIASIM
jgi:hypothetical protein